MAKISILIALLLLCTLVRGQVSPCPQYFQYIMDPETNEVLGQIEIPSPPKNVQLHIRVIFKINTQLPTRYVGRLELLRSKEESVRDVEQGRSLMYRLYFPLRNPISSVIGIWFNGEQYCSGPDPPGNFITTIELEHTLFPPNVLPLSASGSRPTSAPTPPKKPPREHSRVTLSPGIINNVFLYPTMAPQSIPQPAPQLPPRPIPQPTRRPIRPTRPPTPRPIPQPVPTPQSAPQPVSQSHNQCGISQHVGGNVNLLISNGQKTLPGQWPWLVALFIVRTEHVFQCAGSILTHKHVITAAHCLKFSSYTNETIPPNVLEVALGRFHLHAWREQGTENRQVASYIIHPDYAHSNTGDSDLAILILRTPVEYSSFIKPVCMWSGPTRLQSVVNKMAYVVGWGRDEFGHRYTEEPRMAMVPIVSLEDCLLSDPRFIYLISNRTFCAGLQDNSGPCNGDSGSGLVLFDPVTRRYQLRGIVSRSVYDRSEPVCDLTKYIVFVDVARYSSWILQQISQT
ncbi:serine protease gd-like [Pogonomyrmex barbatus]|uniref:Serine protease gd-like n=1 Tax=Pogonomyrmex barbatus TaxID=144034 RepID=A0A6I9VVK9_9HYME|nr:serine protease gd-like [Pogonomyrmex barbatus]